ncbi:MAG: putative Ig domain-containing protein [Paracoccaceae bacterium]
MDWGDGRAVETIVGPQTQLSTTYTSVGNYTISVTATDADGATSPPATANVTVNAETGGPNEAPAIARIPRQIATEGTVFTLDLSTFTIDPNGDVLSYEILSGPVGATVDASTGIFTWNTPSDASTARVQIRVTDDDVTPLSDTASFVIVTPNPRAAVAINGPATAVVGQEVTITPSVVDPDGDENGRWYVSWGDGVTENVVGSATTLTHTYTDEGRRTVRVTAYDENGVASENSATLVIQVTDPSSAPVWSPIPTTTVAATETFSLDLDAFVGDADGDLSTISLLAGPQGASIDPATNVVTWTVPADMSGNVRFRVAAEDATGNEAARTFTVRVPTPPLGGTPDAAPVWAPLTTQQVTQGELYQFDLSTISSDADADPLSYQVISGPSGLTVDPVSGLLSWTPAADEARTTEATVRVRDDGPGSKAADLRISFRVTNPAPTVTLTAPAIVATGQTVTVNPVANDPDGDAIDRWRVNWGDGTREFVDGSVTALTHVYDRVAGSRVIRVEAIDAEGRMGQAATHALQVTDGDQSPVWVPIVAPVAVEGTPYTLDLSGFVSDPESAGLTFRLTEAPAGATIDPVTGELSWTPPANAASSYRFTIEAAETAGEEQASVRSFNLNVREVAIAGPRINLSGSDTAIVGATYTLTPTPVDPAVDQVTRFRVNWGDGSFETFDGPLAPVTHTYVRAATHVISVTPFGPTGTGETVRQVVSAEPRNSDPVWTPILPQTVQEGSAFALDLSALVSDPDAGDVLSLSVLSGPEGMTIGADNVLRWTAPNDFGRDVTVRLLAQDDDLHDQGRDIVSFRLNVEDPAPVAAFTLDDLIINVGETATIRPTATDADGDPIAFWRVNWGDGTSEVVDGTATEISHTYTARGNRTITLVAESPSGERSDAVRQAIRVERENAAPTLGGAGAQTVNPGDVVTFDFGALANDPDASGTLSFLLLNRPDGATIDPVTGVMTWTVPAGADGRHTVRVQVSDNDPIDPRTRERTYVFNVVGAGQGAEAAPVWTPVANTRVDEGTAFSLDLAPSVADPAGAGVAFSLVSAPEGMTLTADGQLSWNVPGDVRRVEVTVRATGLGTDPSYADDTFVINVRNLGAVAQITAPSAATAGALFTFTPTAVDPGNDDIAEWQVNWGDGNVERVDGSLATLGHVYRESGSYNVRLRAIDSDGRFGATTSLRIDVAAASAAPIWQDIPVQAVAQGETFTLDLSSLVSDPESDPFNLILVGGPEGATLSPTGVLTWTAGADTLRNATFQVVAREAGGEGRDVSTRFRVAVSNPAPVASITADATGSVGVDFTLTPGATDADGDQIARYLIDWGDGTRTTVSGDSGPLTHRYGVAGTETIRVWAYDADGARSEVVTQDVTINAHTGAPITSQDAGGIGAVVGAAGVLAVSAKTRAARRNVLRVADVVSMESDGEVRFVAQLDEPAEEPVKVLFGFRGSNDALGQSHTGEAIIPRGRSELVLSLDTSECAKLSADGQIALDLYGVTGAEFETGGFCFTAHALVAGSEAPQPEAFALDSEATDLTDLTPTQGSAPAIVWN